MQNHPKPSSSRHVESYNSGLGHFWHSKWEIGEEGGEGEGKRVKRQRERKKERKGGWQRADEGCKGPKGLRPLNPYVIKNRGPGWGPFFILKILREVSGPFAYKCHIKYLIPNWCSKRVFLIWTTCTKVKPTSFDLVLENGSFVVAWMNQRWA